MSTHKNLFRILTAFLTLVLLGSLGWVRVSGSPVAAQEPETEEPVLSILIIPEGEGVGVANVGTIPIFRVGETFRVSIVALGITEPGMFGGQFDVFYETEHLEAMEGSLQSGEAMEPVVTALQEIDTQAGTVRYAASRQGDVDNLTGNVVLATFQFKAVGATPEGETTLIDLENVKLGAKGGIEVPVVGVVDLEVIIVEDNENPDGDPGDIVGNVKVEGRADDNQADHTVTLDSLTEMSNSTGFFLFDEVASGTYTATADRAGFLAATCDSVEHSDDVLTTLEDVVLLAGDINSDDEIDITDAVAIGVALDSADEVADLNADGIVDVLDLILMAVNHGQTSEANPWVCQLGTEL
jgi:hypothetical protein